MTAGKAHSGHRSAVAVLLLSCLLPAAADDRLPLPSETSYLADVPTVLTASRMEQPIDQAPAAVSVIDREMIRASGARSIVELLRLVPGFTVLYANATQIGVAPYGLDEAPSRRMQVLINGRSVYLPTTGGVAWADLPLNLEDVARIEVVRGPNTASYGANAFLGVINIITRYSFEKTGTLVQASSGSADYRRVVLRHAAAFGDNSFRITASGERDDGFDGRHDSSETAMVTARYDDFGAFGNYMVEAGVSRGPRQSGRTTDALSNPHSRDDLYHYEQFRWELADGPGSQYTLQLFHQRQRIDERYVTMDTNLGLMSRIDYSYWGQRYDAEFQHNFTLGRRVDGVWGAVARLDQVYSPTYLGTDATLENSDYQLFGHLQGRLSDSLTLAGGAMFEQSDVGGSNVSPRLALIYALGPGQTLRASAATATRYPVLYEDRADVTIQVSPIGNWNISFPLHLMSSAGNLKPELIRAYELGYVAHTRTLDTRFTARVFHDEMRRMISEESSTYKNLNWINTEGFELELSMRPTRRGRIVASYAHAETRTPDLSGEGIEAATPRHTYSVLLSQGFGAGFEASLNYYHMGQIHGWGTGDDTGPINRLDLRTAVERPIGSSRLTAAVMIQNVLDERYADYAVDNLSGRRLFLELSLQL